MSMELEGRMSEMCNVSDYWEEVATEEGKEIGKEIGVNCPLCQGHFELV